MSEIYEYTRMLEAKVKALQSKIVVLELEIATIKMLSKNITMPDTALEDMTTPADTLQFISDSLGGMKVKELYALVKTLKTE